MTGLPDVGLTLVLLAPLVAAGVAVLASRWYASPRPRRRRRLTDAELRRLHPMIAERAGKFP